MKTVIVILAALSLASCTKKIEVPKKKPGVYVITPNPDPVPPKYKQVK